MGWLRREKDVIDLFVVWAILLQALTFSFTAGLNAAAMTSSAGDAVLCTSRGVAVVPNAPAPSHQTPDCQHCVMACRQGCGSSCGGILPALARVQLPSSPIVAAVAPEPAEPVLKSAHVFSAEPRAPPFA
ncbi:MAG: hypothetical protein ACREDO_10730 [Methyloceanibacter sp.]